MPITLTIKDETATGAVTNEVQVSLSGERTTVKDIIEARLRAEVVRGAVDISSSSAANSSASDSSSLHGKVFAFRYLRLKANDMTQGPIVIVDDDPDDQDIYAEAIKAIGISNEIRPFQSGPEVLEYLNTTEEQPFIILSDINMPGMTGLELKKYLQEDPYLTAKGIPFVFISTNATKASVRHAHALSVQGYFQKPSTMEDIKNMLRILFDYWELCRHINNT